MAWGCSRLCEGTDRTLVLLMFHCDSLIEITYNHKKLVVHDQPYSVHFADDKNLRAATSIHRSRLNCHLRFFQPNKAMDQGSQRVRICTSINSLAHAPLHSHSARTSNLILGLRPHVSARKAYILFSAHPITKQIHS